MDFDTAFETLVGHEGGFTDNPRDRGNWTTGAIGQGECKGTKFGLSAMTYPTLDIRNLTREDVRPIFRRDFWSRAGCDRFVTSAPELAYDLFDTAINSGPGRAIQFLQRAAGVTDDGALGPMTVQAVGMIDPDVLHARFNGWRLDFMNDNPEQWGAFGRGWAQRIAEILKATGKAKS